MTNKYNKKKLRGFIACSNQEVRDSLAECLTVFIQRMRGTHSVGKELIQKAIYLRKRLRMLEPFSMFKGDIRKNYSRRLFILTDSYGENSGREEVIK